jgi:ankyrin repeat protein
MRHPPEHEAPAARKLLARGAAVDAATKRASTPLMIASCDGDAACVRLLLGAGADTQLVSNDGRTAHSIAGRRRPAATDAIRALLLAAP